MLSKGFQDRKNNPSLFCINGNRFKNGSCGIVDKVPVSIWARIVIWIKIIDSGFTMEEVQAVRSPIGLNISARTPEEIALSIMSEIVGFRLGGDGGTLKLDQRLIDKAAEKAAARPQSTDTAESAESAEPVSAD